MSTSTWRTTQHFEVSRLGSWQKINDSRYSYIFNSIEHLAEAITNELPNMSTFSLYIQYENCLSCNVPFLYRCALPVWLRCDVWLLELYISYRATTTLGPPISFSCQSCWDASSYTVHKQPHLPGQGLYKRQGYMKSHPTAILKWNLWWMHNFTCHSYHTLDYLKTFIEIGKFGGFFCEMLWRSTKSIIFNCIEQQLTQLYADGGPDKKNIYIF